jgi:copper oxidase (laccase) domain-containing protein
LDGARLARAGHGASGEHDPAGRSQLPPYDGFNLAGHVGDDPLRVAGNRRRLAAVLGLPAEPAWLEQVHGIHAVVAAETVKRAGRSPTPPGRANRVGLRGDDR